MLRFNQSANSIVGGIHVAPSDRWDLGLHLNYTAADAGLDPFDLSAPDYSATHPSMSFDFSQSHTYSNLDMSRLDGHFDLKYKFRDDFWLRFWYRIVDYVDDAPYMYDTSGKVQWASFAAGWNF
jgi:hypothetical protein